MNARAPRCALCVQYRIAAVGVSGKEMSDVDRWSGSNSCRAYLTQPNARDLRAALVVRNDRSIFKGQSVDNVSRLSVVLVYRQREMRDPLPAEVQKFSTRADTGMLSLLPSTLVHKLNIAAHVNRCNRQIGT